MTWVVNRVVILMWCVAETVLPCLTFSDPTTTFTASDWTSFLETASRLPNVYWIAIINWTRASFVLHKFFFFLLSGLDLVFVLTWSMILFNLGMLGLWVWSSTMNPRPPSVNMKDEAKPSMMYCPLIRYCMKATGREWPCSSVVEPMDGGSTMMS